MRSRRPEARVHAEARKGCCRFGGGARSRARSVPSRLRRGRVAFHCRSGAYRHPGEGRDLASKGHGGPPRGPGLRRDDDRPCRGHGCASLAGWGKKRPARPCHGHPGLDDFVWAFVRIESVQACGEAPFGSRTFRFEGMRWHTVRGGLGGLPPRRCALQGRRRGSVRAGSRVPLSAGSVQASRLFASPSRRAFGAVLAQANRPCPSVPKDHGVPALQVTRAHTFPDDFAPAARLGRSRLLSSPDFPAPPGDHSACAELPSSLSGSQCQERMWNAILPADGEAR